MELVSGDVVKTTTTIAADDGDAESVVVAGSLAVIHELPSDNHGMYSIVVGTKVYDVELWEIERIDVEARTGGHAAEASSHEALWLKGVQIWLQSGCATGSCVSTSVTAALDLLRRSLDLPCSHMSDVQLAPRELFCAMSLHGLGSHKLALPHFERSLSLLFKCINVAPNEEEYNGMLEIAFREYADTLEQTCDIQQARQVALRAVHCGILWDSKWQRPNFLLSGLVSQPFWEPAENWVQELETNVAVVYEELHSLMQHDVWRSETRPHALARGTWQERVLFGKGGQPELAPKTSALVQKLLPSAVDLCESGAGEVLFSVLGPHTHVSPHCAPHNLRLTAHLGLLVPPADAGRCALRVQDTWKEWQEGKILIFDDSFEHEVVNETSQTRVVLLMRYWHPALQNDPKRQAQALDKFRRQSEARSKFKAIPPLGSKDLQLRLSGTSNCPQCKQEDQDLAISFVWGAQPYMKARCTCGFELASCLEMGASTPTHISCAQSPISTVCLSDMD